MITLKALSKQLNLSVSTVSKALNDSHEISSETIERVKALAELHNYRPNRLALRLKNSKTNTIGVIVPNILNPFFAKVLSGIENEASKQGYDIIICISNESEKQEQQSINLLSSGSVDGFIASLSNETQQQDDLQHFKTLLNQKTPLVLFDRVTHNIESDKIINDDLKVTHLATKHLIKEGRQKIALISNISELNAGKLRIEGYKKALKDAINYTSEPIIISINDTSEIDDAIVNHFKKHPDTDGVLSIDNTTGIAALNIARAKGYNVPEDLSVIGFSNNDMLPLTYPKLSTVDQHPEVIGEESLKMLIERIKDTSKANETKIIESQLILRSTTKAI